MSVDQGRARRRPHLLIGVPTGWAGDVPAVMLMVRRRLQGLSVGCRRHQMDLVRENARLRRPVAELSSEKQVLADVASGNL